VLRTPDHGRPFASAAAFGNKFADWCNAAQLEPVVCADGKVRNYRAHGLRKAACMQLAHAGCTGPEIMAVSGHRIDPFARPRRRSRKSRPSPLASFTWSDASRSMFLNVS
jgi:hypothetical protein